MENRPSGQGVGWVPQFFLHPKSYSFVTTITLSVRKVSVSEQRRRQAGAELCQALVKLGLSELTKLRKQVWLILTTHYFRKQLFRVSKI